MTQRLSLLVIRLLSIMVGFLAEFLRFGRGVLRPRASLVAENLFLKKQLAFYRERHVARRRLTDSAKLSLLLWSRCFEWEVMLVFLSQQREFGPDDTPACSSSQPHRCWMLETSEASRASDLHDDRNRILRRLLVKLLAAQGLRNSPRKVRPTFRSKNALFCIDLEKMENETAA